MLLRCDGDVLHSEVLLHFPRAKTNVFMVTRAFPRGSASGGDDDGGDVRRMADVAYAIAMTVVMTGGSDVYVDGGGSGGGDVTPTLHYPAGPLFHIFLPCRPFWLSPFYRNFLNCQLFPSFSS